MSTLDPVPPPLPSAHPVPTHAAASLLRGLPSVDLLLNHPTIRPLIGEFPRSEVVASVREMLDDCRAAARAGDAAPEIAALALRVREKLAQRARPRLRKVINATGIVLHTNLGRAPLAAEAIEAVSAVAAGYSNLELDLETGERGDRHAHTRDLLRELTGAEDALVVNNNAAATFLTLRALTAGREVIVSRGQLVEIGGSYRMPDIMAAAGCRMVEVGTTNRTHLADYQRSVRLDTAALLRVHTSNYRVVGFTASPELRELVQLARQYDGNSGTQRGLGAGRMLVIDDLGSGLLLDAPAATSGLRSQTTRLAPSPPFERDGDDEELPRAERLPLPTFDGWDEPAIRDSLRAGADVVLFSGDKLLGGPQAGIILGRADAIAAIRRDPLMRAMRPDKMTLAALEATLRLYRDPETAYRRIPALRMLLAGQNSIEPLARRLAAALARAVPSIVADAVADHSYAGGGSLPMLEMPTWVVRVRHPRTLSDALASSLRRRDLPIIARLHDGCLILDCRTIEPEDLEAVVPAVADCVSGLID